MLAPRSLIDIIIPTSIESSSVDVEMSYPFLSPLDLGDLDLESAQTLVEEICEWLDTTIGLGPKWRISTNTPSWWGHDDNGVSMIFLFKTKEDAVAFKLRWL